MQGAGFPYGNQFTGRERGQTLVCGWGSGRAIALPSSDRDFSKFPGARLIKDRTNLFYP